MEMIKVGICFDDRRFAMALAKGLARESRTMNFQLLDSLLAGDDCDMILTQERNTHSKTVEMVLDSHLETQNDNSPYRIFRYKRSDEMVNDLLFVYFKMTGKVLEYRSNSTCSLVALFSDSGGAGVTSMGISLGNLLYRFYGRKCIYLNLCPINGSRQYIESSEPAEFLKLLYYLDTDRDFPLDRFISHSNDLDFIDTGAINPYFDDVKPIMMKRLLERIDLLGRYQYVLLDMGNHYARESRKILENVNLLLEIHRNSRNASDLYREEIWKEIGPKTATALRFSINNFANSEESWDNNQLYISEDVSAFTSNSGKKIEIDLSKNYGLEIGEIAKRIVEGDEHD